MKRALIGHTGFVGGNIRSQAHFEVFYNSTNIHEIAGCSFDLVVCAGAPAEKWKANQDPEGDIAALAKLQQPLAAVRAQEVVLISTVDVYPNPIGVDEETFIDPDSGAPYGRHRLALEKFVAERFSTLVVRLPGLFGPGLKKNAIYDLLHDNMTEAIHADSVFQFYDVSRLWSDIQRFRAARLKLINVATEPVSMREVANEAFGILFDNRPPRPPVKYDFRTLHAEAFGGTNGYLIRKREVLDAIRAFVNTERTQTR